MRISLQNVGKIRSAEVDLDGLTVISGKNNSGKSTVGKSLYAIIKILNHFANYNERIAKIKFKENVTVLRFKVREFNKILMDDSVLGQSEDEVKLKDLYNRLSSDSFTSLSYDEQSKIIDEIIALPTVEKSTDRDIIIGKLKEIKNNFRPRNEEENLKDTAEAVFLNNMMINNSVHQGDANVTYEDGNFKIVSLTIRNEQVISAVVDKRVPFFQDVTFVESARHLGLRNQDKVLTDNIDKFYSYPERFGFEFDLASKIAIAGENFEANKSLLSEMEYETLNVFGKVFDKSAFFYDKTRDGIRYKAQSTAVRDLSLRDVASGAKCIGLLYILWKAGALDNNHVLVLDEPENHLHPKWQVALAEIICLLVKSGIFVTMTSHSPYLIRSLFAYAEKHELTEKNKVNFYLAQPVGEVNENYCDIVNVKDKHGNIRIDKIYDELYDSLVELEELDKGR